jgi:hypothetical protein
MSAQLPGSTWLVIIAFIILALVPTGWYFFNVFKSKKKG